MRRIRKRALFLPVVNLSRITVTPKGRSFVAVYAAILALQRAIKEASGRPNR